MLPGITTSYWAFEWLEQHYNAEKNTPSES